MNTLQVNSECRYTHSADLTIALAALIWDTVEECVALRDRAQIVLSGGSTPAGLYNVLRELPLPWEKLAFCPSDERWVPVSDNASNEGMFLRELLGPDSPSRLLSMARTGDEPEADAERASAAIASLDNPFDLVLLGMGTDGHTASLFPGAPGLAEALEADAGCVVVRPESAVRLTLSRRALLNSRQIVLLLRGADKWKVYQEALAGDDVSAMPVRAILHQDQVPVNVYCSFD